MPAPSTSSAARRAQAHADLRAKILAAATAIVVGQGFEALTLRRIGDQVGYSAATIYLYFANKDALIFALLDEGYALLSGYLAEAAAQPAAPLDRIRAVGRAYIAFGRAHPQTYQLLFQRRADFLQARLAERPEAGAPFSILQESVTAAIAAGALPPGDTLSYSLTLWATVHGLVGLLLIAPPLPEEQIAQIITTAVETCVGGLSALVR